jgi:hypothetical protein
MQNDGMMQADTGNCTVVPPSNVCGLDPQCGCGSMGTCDVDFQKLDGTTKCVQTMGSGMIKSACKMTTDCSAGLTCVFGACRPYCATAGAACGITGTGNCQQVQNTSMMDIVNLKVCLIACALDDANSCGGLPSNMSDPVATCVPTVSNTTDCETAGRSTTTCGGQVAPFCAPGYACVNSATCQKWCKVGGSGQCVGAQTCGGFTTRLIIGGVEYGSCR